MSFASIRAAIAATLNGVAGIGLVHERERYARRAEHLKTFYVTGGEIRGWFIRREATQESSRHQGRSVETITWQIRGFMSFVDEDDSEFAFDDLIEAIRDAFRVDESLGGTVDQIALPTSSEFGIQVIDSGPAMFAGVLVHTCRLRLSTVRYL